MSIYISIYRRYWRFDNVLGLPLGVQLHQSFQPQKGVAP